MRPPANCSPPACPECGAFLTKVVCTKKDDQQVTVRRRNCLICDHRFYTTQELAPPEVAVKEGQVKWLGRGKKQYVVVRKTLKSQDPIEQET